MAADACEETCWEEEAENSRIARRKSPPAGTMKRRLDRKEDGPEDGEGASKRATMLSMRQLGRRHRVSCAAGQKTAPTVGDASIFCSSAAGASYASMPFCSMATVSSAHRYKARMTDDAVRRHYIESCSICLGCPDDLGNGNIPPVCSLCGGDASIMSPSRKGCRERWPWSALICSSLCDSTTLQADLRHTLLPNAMGLEDERLLGGNHGLSTERPMSSERPGFGLASLQKLKW